MKYTLKSQRVHRCNLSTGYLQPYLETFMRELFEMGYTELTIRSYHTSIAHFGAWLKKKGILLKNLRSDVVGDFAKHHCRCFSGGKRKRVSSKYVNRIRRFMGYLGQQDIISSKLNPTEAQRSPYVEKFKKSLQIRGLAARTIITYEHSIYTVLPLLGNKPKKYTAMQVRKAIYNMGNQKSRCEVKNLTTALRAYLRFLTTEGTCCPDLDSAVPTVAEWKLSSLPKYITEQEVERTITACDIQTRQGVRDRAILLLLSRLGLRAGDVSNMQIDDIDWSEGTLCVSGKGRRAVRLPLPQEVGDALLAYIEKVRPAVNINTLFLCLNAPYRPFSSSSGISNIVSAALKRAGITNPPSRGAHLLRHSVATQMLRKGATLETVSTVLRHRSLDMTAYYAKVDIPRLRQIAQPWPEGSSC